MWLKDDNILELLKEWWNATKVSRSGIFKIVNKLKIIKQNLIHWNKEHFGNIFDNKAQVEADLVEVNEKVMRHGIDEAVFLREKKLLTDHESILAKEEVFWKQKSRETWLEEGDKNTKFFHNSVRMRRVINHISKINLSDGSEVANPKSIATEAVDIFSLILNFDWSPHGSIQDKFIRCIPKLLSKGQTNSLTAKFSLAEVEATLMQMSPDKSPGSDGFLTSFFKKCWPFLGVEVTTALEGMRNLGSILKEINNTFLALIPKKDKPEHFDEFGSIALCNTIYKLFSKTLANRI
ncbi:uncharacterized protein LOC131858937 [Cryptomeria japonica]|uniref:uncharacterized protein LOC131858937 n=1 Tax=Cryptomeria japonica TaxID=3369 RepID=UPI0027DA2EC1|nr:uncharacterized protein LOC131858937 [Cryptomeria japonica]